MATKYRYPGLQPFTTSQKHLFFGRDADIQRLAERVVSEKLTVLYSKSGYGKSSLINAGLIPALENEPDDKWKIIKIRFGSYFDENQPSPLKTTFAFTKDLTETQYSFYLDKLCPDDDIIKNSLWYRFKKMQDNHGLDTKYCIVFDQFEELFSYPVNQVKEFQQELARLLNHLIPQGIIIPLKEAIANQTELLSVAEIAKCYQPVNIHVVMSIRSDRMSLLNRMSSDIPDVLTNCYELAALDKEQALKAILTPASLEGDFNSPQFEYEPEALEKILEALAPGNSNAIEAFQLQVICQYAEQKILGMKIANFK